MKRTLLAIVATLMMTTTMNAQRLTDVIAEARFITDKMVVELGLTNVQRNSILNLNLTYLDGINSYRDIDARGWRYRNQKIRAMLTAKQWRKFRDCYYFYRPISWCNNAYVHNVYNRYGRQTPPPPPPPRWDKRMDKGPRPDCGYDKPGRPRSDQPGRPGFDRPREPRFDRPGKPGKKDKFFKNDRSRRDKDRPGFGRREFDNNSPEAIKMRQDMRKGNRWAR